jgi:hypothetical protein
MSTPSEPANALPRTIHRLFVTSLVLIAIITAISATYPTGWFSIFGLIPIAILLGTVLNHLLLWHLARKETLNLSESADGQVEGTSTVNGVPIGTYPMCLINIPNIVWTCFVALLLLGFMWMPIFSSSMAYDLDKLYPQSEYSMAASIMYGVFGYAECGVLFALFGLYIRERRRLLGVRVESQTGPKV